MRLIDAYKLKSCFTPALTGRTEYSADEILLTIATMPTVDAEIVRHGHWIEQDGYDGDVYYDCSVCGNSWTTIDGTPQDNGMNYCPNCGAKMDEVEDGKT